MPADLHELARVAAMKLAHVRHPVALDARRPELLDLVDAVADTLCRQNDMHQRTAWSAFHLAADVADGWGQPDMADVMRHVARALVEGNPEDFE